MSIHNEPVTMHFIRLTDAARVCGAASVEQFVADLRTLTPSELREVGDLVSEEG